MLAHTAGPLPVGGGFFQKRKTARATFAFNDTRHGIEIFPNIGNGIREFMFRIFKYPFIGVGIDENKIHRIGIVADIHDIKQAIPGFDDPDLFFKYCIPVMDFITKSDERS